MPRSRLIPFAAVFVLLVGVGGRHALAQDAEVGFGGGGSLYMSNTATAPGGEAKAGFEYGFSASGWIGHNMYRHLGGEIRYQFQKNNLKLSQGGTKVTFGGRSHAIHYDLLIHTAPRGASVRPFLAVGGGMKGYFGTGTETVYQPLWDFALLTKTSEWRALATVGGGIKFEVSPGVNFRVEFRDYITPFPTKVIAPVPGAEISGWSHNFVPMFGISFTF